MLHAALSDPNSLHTPVSFPSFPSLSCSGLVDSGSMDCFANTNFVSKNSFSTYPILPVVLHLLDGSAAVVIDHTMDLSVRFSTNDILSV